MKYLLKKYRVWYVKTHYYPNKHPRHIYLWPLVLVLALWGYSVREEYQHRLDVEIVAQEAPKAYQQALLDCMSASANNEQGGFYLPDSGKSFQCSIKEL